MCGKDVSQTYSGHHFTIYTNIESYCTSESNIICQLYINLKNELCLHMSKVELFG